MIWTGCSICSLLHAVVSDGLHHAVSMYRDIPMVDTRIVSITTSIYYKKNK